MAGGLAEKDLHRVGGDQGLAQIGLQGQVHPGAAIGGVDLMGADLVDAVVGGRAAEQAAIAHHLPGRGAGHGAVNQPQPVFVQEAFRDVVGGEGEVGPVDGVEEPRHPPAILRS